MSSVSRVHTTTATMLLANHALHDPTALPLVPYSAQYATRAQSRALDSQSARSVHSMKQVIQRAQRVRRLSVAPTYLYIYRSSANKQLPEGVSRPASKSRTLAQGLSVTSQPSFILPLARPLLKPLPFIRREGQPKGKMVLSCGPDWSYVLIRGSQHLSP